MSPQMTSLNLWIPSQSPVSPSVSPVPLHRWMERTKGRVGATLGLVHLGLERLCTGSLSFPHYITKRGKNDRVRAGHADFFLGIQKKTCLV